MRHPINEVFNAVKDQSWGRCLKPIQHDPALLREEQYYSFHESKGHKIVYCKILQWYLEQLVRQDFLKEYVLTPGAAASAGQSNVSPPTQLQHAIT